MMEKKRIPWIDICKGLMIILVVMGHVTSSYHAAGAYKDSVFLNFSNRFIYSFHMATFMFISGMLFRNKSNYKEQMKRLVVSYGLPYIFFSVIWWLFKTVLSPFVNSTVTLLDILLIPFFPISFLWFIYALMIMEITQVLIGKKNKRKCIIQFVVAVLFYVVSPMISNIRIFNSAYHFSDWVINDIMKNYVYFSIGVYFGELLSKWVIQNRKICFGVFGCLLIAGNIILYLFPERNGLAMKFVLAMSGIVFSIAACSFLRSTLLVYLGQRTLPIYVLQGIFIATTRVILGKFHMNDPIGIVPLGLCTIFGIGVPLVLYETCKKIGKLDFIFTPGKYLR